MHCVEVGFAEQARSLALLVQRTDVPVPHAGASPMALPCLAALIGVTSPPPTANMPHHTPAEEP